MTENYASARQIDFRVRRDRPKLVPQVRPVRVGLFNQIDLPPARPFLDPLLTVNGLDNDPMRLPPDQAGAPILAREFRGGPVLVLPDAPKQMGCDPCINHAIKPVRHHVDSNGAFPVGHARYNCIFLTSYQ